MIATTMAAGRSVKNSSQGKTSPFRRTSVIEPKTSMLNQDNKSSWIDDGSPKAQQMARINAIAKKKNLKDYIDHKVYRLGRCTDIDYIND
jgi:hypothetical protein